MLRALLKWAAIALAAAACTLILSALAVEMLLVLAGVETPAPGTDDIGYGLLAVLGFGVIASILFPFCCWGIYRISSKWIKPRVRT